MNVVITDIVQRYSLSSGDVVSYLVLALPGGREIQAQVSDEDTQSIIQASQLGSAERPPPIVNFDPTSPPMALHFPDAVPPPPPVQQEYINWSDLDEVTLPPLVRQIFEASQLDTIMPRTQFESLKEQVLRRINSDGAVQANSDYASRVNWNQGTRRESAHTPRRTVEATDMGYPLPPGGIVEADPGEVSDDDEVQQG